MVPAWVSLFDGILGIALVAAGLLSAHFGALAPFLGFRIFLLGFFFSVLAVSFGLIAIFFTPAGEQQKVRPRAVRGTVLGLVIALPILAVILRATGYPSINDLTTDIDNPPEFAYAPRLGANQGRNMGYNKVKCAAAQRRAYGDLAPLKMAGDPGAVFKRVRAAAASMPSWQITYADERTHTLEGVTTSDLFRFQNDFVIQVRPGDGGTSLVEMRSKSRDGTGDLGANYRQIKAFFAKLAPAQPRLRA